MAYQALYRKWRPTVFDDVVGQGHITQTLKNEITSGRCAHAYLFTGIRGTGKTSTAKIFSRAINCINNTDGNPCNECEICKGILDGSILDVVEMDAASNNGVDNIRDLRDDVIYTASSAKYKVYIIDEVHMLSTGAFNALLKTLEEPPEHVKFILATTEVHKLPQTILSRCQRFDFRAITQEDIAGRIKEILLSDGYNVTDEALSLVAEMADGSMRDGLSLMDRCLSFGASEVTYNDVINILGVADEKLSIGILEAIADENTQKAIELLADAIAQGKAPARILEGLMSVARNLLMFRLMDNPDKLFNPKKFSEAADKLTQEQLIHCINVFSKTLDNIKFSTSKRVVLELAVIELCMPVFSAAPESMASRLSVLEKKIEEGVKAVAATPKKVAADETPKEKKIAQRVNIEFSGKYKDKKTEIVSELKTKNPGLAVFLNQLELAGENEIMLIIAKDEKGENAVNFLKSADKFKETMLLCTEKVCGTTPKRIEFEANVTQEQNASLAEKFEGFDFIKIHR